MNGSGSAARFSGPNGVAEESSGNLFVTDSGNNRITEDKPMPFPIITTQPQNASDA